LNFAFRTVSTTTTTMLLVLGAIFLPSLFGPGANALYTKSPMGHDVIIGKCDPMIPCSVANSECYDNFCVCKEGHVPIYKNTYQCRNPQAATYNNYNYGYTQTHTYGSSTTNYNSCIESCLPASDYKMTCVTDEQCRPKLGKHASCIQFLNGNRGGTCGCRRPTAQGGGWDGYHYAEGKCWPSRSIGINCQSHMTCTTENSFCEDMTNNSTESMMRYGMRSYKVCKCQKDFPIYYEPDDKCVAAAGYGEKCEFSDQCQEELGFSAVCKTSTAGTKTCKCKTGHTYDKDHNKCILVKKVAEATDD